MRVSVERLAPEQSQFLLLSIVRSPWTPYCLYLLLAGVCWRAYAFRYGPDMISYISIAKEYFAGQWQDAINTFWSPLFSWLIAAGLVTHAAPYTVVRAIVVLCGLLGLACIRRLTLRCNLSRDLSAGVTLFAAPVLASFAIIAPSPDFIAVCLLTLYFSTVCTCSAENRRSWLLAGVIGALLYLTKAYMFGFVIAHLTVTTILLIWSSLRRSAWHKILRNYLGALACLFALSSPWLVLIGLKGGHPMLSATGTWNYAKARMDPRWFPHITEGLFPPPNAAAVSVWEDPGRMHLVSWNPFSSVAALRRQIYLIARNSLYLLYFTLRASVLSVLIVPFFAWMVFRRIRQQRVFDCPACLLSAYVIYPLGYIPIALGEQRYVWIENILLLLMAGSVANLLWMQREKPPRLLISATVVAGLSFWCDPLATVVYHWGNKRDLHLLAESLRPLKLSGNVASNGLWEESLYLSYELGLRYYGIPKKESMNDVERDLRNSGIKYLFVWKGPSTFVPIGCSQELSDAKTMKVYRLCISRQAYKCVNAGASGVSDYQFQRVDQLESEGVR